MCIGIPMQVEAVDDMGRAVCLHAGAQHRIDTALVGEVAPGEWVMTFLGAAREKMDEASARRSLDAIAAVEAIMSGGTANIEAAFADLIGREPTLPPHLQAQQDKDPITS
ncbi:HypC/HybG/HupF family hydrogenase formation chaperone [Croceicoccus gelatinilyticus]|uniref:HypC/HybG/HupF family hydrogenase formation chaperone n=1 Tax=Croceicoccus gelatinilyticus TaxID=2835536 RepID=UPI001BCADD0E|nr:HypC/HybG/HupF family hydrogenase formation chaperone [Croceicoccus gelatinilyticus]MBS7669304.1 HypC/HybG/HupF family hydrogenase formation chaperone [Croceicoccus gelatinilyticus]